MVGTALGFSSYNLYLRAITPAVPEEEPRTMHISEVEVGVGVNIVKENAGKEGISKKATSSK